MIDNVLQEFSLFISKSSFSDGVMKWSAINSDTDWDLYGERMSLELYRSMISKIRANEPPPEPFKEYVTSDYWQGGMPYLSIAHYPDGNGKAVPGDVRELFIDGKQLKAKGTLFNSPLGQAVWKSLKEDELNYKNLVDKDRIRISIAFLDLAHRHGDDGKIFERKSISDVCPECKSGKGQKIYLDGYLVHLALTRVPVNPRTIMEAEDAMARKSKIETREDDAVSIVGDEKLVEEIKSAVGLEERSILVEMSEATAEDVPSTSSPEPVEVKSVMESAQAWKPFGGATSMKEAKQYTEAQQESWRISDLYYTFTDVARNIMDSEEITDKAETLASLVDEFKQGLVAKSLYEELQQIHDGKLEEVYMTVKKSEIEEVVSSLVAKALPKVEAPASVVEPVVENAPVAVEVPAPQIQKSTLEQSLDNLYNTVRSVISQPGTAEDKLRAIQPALEVVGNEITIEVKSATNTEPVAAAQPDPNSAILEAIQNLSLTVESIKTEFATIKAQSTPVNTTERVPVPRSISVQRSVTEAPAQPAVNPNSVANIVRRTVDPALPPVSR